MIYNMNIFIVFNLSFRQYFQCTVSTFYLFRVNNLNILCQHNYENIDFIFLKYSYEFKKANIFSQIIKLI